MTSMDTAALIRRTGRNLLLLGAALAAGQLAITIPGRELIRQAVRGPMPVSTPQLAEGLSALGDGFVEVRGVAVEPSAVRPTNHRGSKQGDRYALLALEDRSVVLVVASKAPTTTTISGVARPLALTALGQTEAGDHFLDGCACYAKLVFPDREQRRGPDDLAGPQIRGQTGLLQRRGVFERQPVEVAVQLQ